MRLDISWKLEYQNESYYNRWAQNADSLRMNQDLNNGYKGDNQTSFETVRRTIEMYRRYMITQFERTDTLTIYPDLNNLFVGNSEKSSGLTDDQRRIVYSHWIGAGANLIHGSDMTDLDDLGKSMLQNEQFNWIADNFTSRHPMRPANDIDNIDQGQQVQLWIAGPSAKGHALFVWANYGSTDLQLYTGTPTSGVRSSGIPKEDFEKMGLHAGCYQAVNLWDPNDSTNLKDFSSLKTKLDDEQVLVLYLEPNLAIHCDVATAKPF